MHTVETLFAQQDAGTIEVLPVYLHRGYPSHIQLEALHAMYNMCKISPTRQEAAALAGVVPLLVKLAVSPPPEAPLSTTQPPAQSSGAESVSNSGEDVASVSGRALYPLRPLAVSLLCGMAHSTHRTRHELWAHNVVALLLDLLKEEVTCTFCCAKLVCVVIICELHTRAGSLVRCAPCHKLLQISYQLFLIPLQGITPSVHGSSIHPACVCLSPVYVCNTHAGHPASKCCIAIACAVLAL